MNTCEVHAGIVHLTSRRWVEGSGWEFALALAPSYYCQVNKTLLAGLAGLAGSEVAKVWCHKKRPSHTYMHITCHADILTKRQLRHRICARSFPFFKFFFFSRCPSHTDPVVLAPSVFPTGKDKRTTLSGPTSKPYRAFGRAVFPNRGCNVVIRTEKGEKKEKEKRVTM